MAGDAIGVFINYLTKQRKNRRKIQVIAAEKQEYPLCRRVTPGYIFVYYIVHTELLHTKSINT